MAADHYKILNIPPTATKGAVKRAFHELVGQVTTLEELQQLRVALLTLINPGSRRLYDAELESPPELKPEVAKIRGIFSRDPSMAAAQLANLARSKGSPILLRAAGALLILTDQGFKAIRILQRLVEEEPEDAVTLANLGIALYREGRYEKALPLLEKAVALDPSQANAGLFLAKSLIASRQDAAGALAVLDRCLEACDEDWNWRAKLLSSLFFPLTYLWLEDRLEQTVELFLEALTKCSGSTHRMASGILQQTVQLFPGTDFPRESEFYSRFLERLMPFANEAMAEDPQALELCEEQAGLLVDTSIADWIQYLAFTLELIEPDSPHLLTGESTEKELAAIFHAWLRLAGTTKEAEWAAFKSAYPVQAARIPGAFCLGCHGARCSAG